MGAHVWGERSRAQREAAAELEALNRVVHARGLNVNVEPHEAAGS